MKNLILVSSILTLFLAPEAWSQSRTLTQAEMQNYCRTGQLPSGMRIRSGLESLNNYCRQLGASAPSNDNTGGGDNRSLPFFGNSEAAGQPVTPTPYDPQRQGSFGQTAPAQPAAATTPAAAGAPAAGRNNIGSFSGASGDCGDRFLTSGVPRGSASLPSNLAGTDGSTRDQQILAAIRGGGLPSFLSNLQPVQLPANSCTGSSSPITLCVMPDYLSIGTDRQFTHTPLGQRAAAEIAREMGFMLPTTHLVDQIYQQAADRVRAMPRNGSQDGVSESAFYNGHMRRTDVAIRQSERVVGAYNSSVPHGRLRAGHYKDITMTDRNPNFGAAAIYGWYTSGGSRIQSLYLGHTGPYSDYSHGTRLVSQYVYIDGRRVDLADLDRGCASTILTGGQDANLQQLGYFLDGGGRGAGAGTGVQASR